MKRLLLKYDKLFLWIGILISLVPAYHTAGWFYTCYKYAGHSHSEKVIAFQKEVLFGFFETGYPSSSSSTWLFVLAGFISGCFLLFSIVASFISQHSIPTRKENQKMMIRITAFTVNAAFFCWLLWTLM